MEKDLSLVQTVIGGVLLLCILWLGRTPKEADSVDYQLETVTSVGPPEKPLVAERPIYSLSNQLVRATLFMPFPVSLGQPAYGKRKLPKRH